MTTVFGFPPVWSRLQIVETIFSRSAITVLTMPPVARTSSSCSGQVAFGHLAVQCSAVQCSAVPVYHPGTDGQKMKDEGQLVFKGVDGFSRRVSYTPVWGSYQLKKCEKVDKTHKREHNEPYPTLKYW